MNKIQQGIELNKHHLFNIINNISEETSFSSEIIHLGFKNLEDFFEQKREYEMQQSLKNKVYETTPEKAMTTLSYLINNQLYGIVSVNNNQTCVHKGQNKEKTINMQYCQEHNIPIYEYNSYGGNIVATENDYSIALIVPREIDIDRAFVLNHTKNILDKYFKNIIIDGNDILLDGKKVAGATVFEDEHIFFLIYHFSMSPKEELIYNICGNPDTNKQPGFLDQKILSTEELKKELLSWLQGL